MCLFSVSLVSKFIKIEKVLLKKKIRASGISEKNGKSGGHFVLLWDSL